MLALDRSFVRVRAVLAAANGTQFTAAVARVEHRGRVRFERAYGVHVDTPFDLASITKVFVSTLALRAVEQGRVMLDEPLTRWFAQWRERPHAAITLRMLLAHTSGMNSGADYRQLRDWNVVAYALSRELVAVPGERVIYSDLGFIAIGEVLQRIYGRSLAALMRDVCTGAVYRPSSARAAQIPATECDDWRGSVQGVVHDEKAYLMGGVAGHAGLFASAADVAWLAEQYLAVCHGRASVMRADLAREAIREQAGDPVLRRGLGWALKTSDENSCGRWFSRESFGHTGFVGTCLWADPRQDCSGVLLTNSVCFGRRDTRELRAAFYEAAIEDLGLV